jgi:hypothetical protein
VLYRSRGCCSAHSALQFGCGIGRNTRRLVAFSGLCLASPENKNSNNQNDYSNNRASGCRIDLLLQVERLLFESTSLYANIRTCRPVQWWDILIQLDIFVNKE